MQPTANKQQSASEDVARLTFTLKRGELALLRRLAEEEGTSVAHVVRRAVRKYLKDVSPTPLFDQLQ